MEFIGNYKFQIKKEELWENLNNAEIIKGCIDGCLEFKEIEENQFRTKINVKLGPLQAIFQGLVEIKNIKPTESYSIVASGRAGHLGFAKGIVNVELKEQKGFTLLEYKADTQISGKIAQLGARLIEGSVKKNTDSFFSNLQKSLERKNTEGEELKKEISSYGKKSKKYYFIFILLSLFILFTIYLLR